MTYNKKKKANSKSKGSSVSSEMRDGRVNVAKRGPAISSTGTKLNQQNYVLDGSEPKALSTIDTGIKSGLTALTLQGSMNDRYHPLYMWNGLFNVVGGSGSWANSVLQNVIHAWYRNTMQEAINYKIDYSFSDFSDYFTQVTRALQMYYTIESVIQYTNNPLTQNLALEYLRKDITSDVELKLVLLKERLQATVVPPNMLQYIYWMYQHHAFSDIPGSPCHKICFGGLWCGDQTDRSPGGSIYGSVSSLTIQKMIDDLYVLTQSDVGSLMTQVFKPWVIRELPASSTQILYDPNWLTMYSNLLTVKYNDNTGSKALLPVAHYGSETANQHYVSYTNVLDGSITALNNNYVDTSGTVSEVDLTKCGSTLMLPFTYFDSTSVVRGNRGVYDTSQTKLNFLNSYAEVASSSSPLAYSSLLTGVEQVVPSDAELIHDMSLANQTQAITEFMRFLFHIEQIKL